MKYRVHIYTDGPVDVHADNLHIFESGHVGLIQNGVAVLLVSPSEFIRAERLSDEQ